MKRTVLLVLLLMPCLGRSEQRFPPPDWSDAPDPLASPHATVGGEMSVFVGQYSKSFNYYLDNNVFSALMFSFMYETLLDMNPITAEYEPGLADKWTISDDKKTFTFHLDENARWSDGKPVTAADVAWTFRTIMDPRSLTGPHKVSLQTFAPPDVLDERTIRFTASEVHWRNLGAVGGFQIMPEHVFAEKDFNKINFEFPVVSGPYRLGEIKEGIYAKMDRRADWWRRAYQRARNVGNFETLEFRFYAERENAFEAFKKAQFDLYPVYTARLWVNETRGERFAKNWIAKQKVYNHSPIGFQGFAMNLRRPLFQDLRVRKALAMLLDRERMNDTMMYGQYFMHRSYYEDLYSDEHPCTNPVLAFDKEQARRLLREAGWSANPKTGLLEKDGTRFSFRFLTRAASSEKFVNLYAQDLRDVGIELVIDKKDWATWSKDMDEWNFDMTWAAWGAGIFKDPESMWASAEAERPGGNNYTGFKNERVDVLIEKQKTIFDVGKRHDIVRQIDGIVASQCPYVLLWNLNYTRLLYWSKFGTPPTVLSKYGGEHSAIWYWWYDEDSAADLEDAMASGDYLPPRPAEVSFDEEFQP